MKRRFLFSSAVVTVPGVYSYTLIDSEAARAWFRQPGPEPQSAIGYSETAHLLSQVIHTPVWANRRILTMDVGDEALVCRVTLPRGSERIRPQDKGRMTIPFLSAHMELGLLVRLK